MPMLTEPNLIDYLLEEHTNAIINISGGVGFTLESTLGRYGEGRSKRGKNSVNVTSINFIVRIL